MSDPRFPIGRAEIKRELTADERQQAIAAIAVAPRQLRDAVAGLTPEQLDTPYREGGWTVRQVVNHVPDSHLNAYVRFKLALTEDAPAIKTYDEQLWAELADSQITPPEVSLALLDSLHHRWVDLLAAMAAADFQRNLFHAEHGMVTLDAMLSLYAWHGRHHAAHVTALRERMGW